jgi:hypothetical protein
VVCPGTVVSRIGESERTRPAGLATVPRTDPELLARIRATFEGMTADPMDPAELARRVLAGIEEDRLHILTHAESNVPVAERLDRVKAALPAAVHSHAAQEQV